MDGCFYFALVLLSHLLNLSKFWFLTSRYLEHWDPDMHALGKAKIKECYKKNTSGNPQFGSLTTSLKAHLWSTVGEIYWKRAHNYQDYILKQKNERDQMQGQVQHQQQKQMVLPPSPHPKVNSPTNVVNIPCHQPSTSEFHAKDASTE
jgi:hypothetical protein